MYTGKSNNGKATYRCVARSHGKECTKPQVIVADPLDEFVENWWIETRGHLDEVVSVRISDERSLRIAELTLEHRQRKAALATLDDDQIAAEAAELKKISNTVAELRERKGSKITHRRRKTGRLMSEAWEQSSIPERRDLVRRSLAGGFITIGPGRSGIKGFQFDRVTDDWKFDTYEEIVPESTTQEEIIERGGIPIEYLEAVIEETG
jgi:hypothetical protein